MNLTRTRLAAAALGTAIVIALPTAAFAAERPERPFRTEGAERTADIEDIRSRCLTAIEERQTALDKAADRLASAKHVTDEHEAALAAILADTGSSLDGVADDIEAATDLATLRAACRSIFGDHRVFALILPRTRLVVAIDTELAAAAKLDGVADRLEEAGAGAEDLAALRAEIDSARSSVEGLAESLLELTPADWNADHEVLTPAREAVRSARTDLREARELARQIAAGLRS